ncbi:Ras-related protein [Wickerhamomyces ciferrii]|uniref:Ras-related protein n=1 Tax=Wickerhamomyces ciferrii (strain ATCC 14091 / BCRC 22168 / CBS 111 / JCM 3599 / NBRC 0793 / NRRL Y-1031 F-60-10) TaxID=1206466 RepID=K0KTG0_WICCF|nr:Ras-related protein [Wickerhamomyces ciferrii]CCH45297.1 Ras-related protein [Wickerhamomyces ciferrii]
MSNDNDITQQRTAHAKLVLLGKSSIVQRFVKNSFDEYRESTIGAAFITKTIKLDELTSIKFEIWDTAGQERYKSLAPMYYRNANSAILVFDLTDSTSFHKMIKWYEELSLQAPDTLIIKIIGNKLDLKNNLNFNIIDDSTVKQWCDEHKVQYIETSAKTGENVEKIFREIGKDLPDELFKDLKINDERDDVGINGLIDLNKHVLQNKSCNC